MKIYVLTKGAYSDHHIITATTSKEKAKKLAKFFNKNHHRSGMFSDEIKIEEYNEDEFNMDEEMNVYWIHYDMKYNSIINIKISNNPHDFKLTSKGPHLELGSRYTHAYIRANDEEKAKKIFYDELAKKIAEKEGII